MPLLEKLGKCVSRKVFLTSSLLFHTFPVLSWYFSSVHILYEITTLSMTSSWLNHKWESHVFSAHTSHSPRLLNTAVSSSDLMLTFSRVHFIYFHSADGYWDNIMCKERHQCPPSFMVYQKVGIDWLKRECYIILSHFL